MIKSVMFYCSVVIAALIVEMLHNRGCKNKSTFAHLTPCLEGSQREGAYMLSQSRLCLVQKKKDRVSLFVLHIQGFLLTGRVTEQNMQMVDRGQPRFEAYRLTRAAIHQSRSLWRPVARLKGGIARSFSDHYQTYLHVLFQFTAHFLSCTIKCRMDTMLQFSASVNIGVCRGLSKKSTLTKFA